MTNDSDDLTGFRRTGQVRVEASGDVSRVWCARDGREKLVRMEGDELAKALGSCLSRGMLGAIDSRVLPVLAKLDQVVTMQAMSGDYGVVITVAVGKVPKPTSPGVLEAVRGALANGLQVDGTDETIYANNRDNGESNTPSDCGPRGPECEAGEGS